MTKFSYDIIVIGGGHNGLVAATALAKRAKKVLVLEKRAVLGGIASGEEFYPGYKSNGLLHDTSGVRSKMVKGLGLEKYGLKFKQTKAAFAVLSKSHDPIIISDNLDHSVKEIAKISEKDAAAYVHYRAFIKKISPFISNLTDNIPPDLEHFGLSEIFILLKKGYGLKRLGNKTMLELLKVAPMCVADFLNEKFETESIKSAIAGPSIYGSYTGPWSPYTTLNQLLYECTAKNEVIGGPQALISALEKAAIDAKVSIQKDAQVEKIILDNNQAMLGVQLISGEQITCNKVLATCTPKTAILNLLTGPQIGLKIEQGLLNYRSRGTTAKMHLALSKPFKFHENSEIAFARTGNSFDEMEKAFDFVKYREFSSEPILDLHIPSIANPGLAPEGHSVLSALVHFAAHNLEGGWTNAQKEQLGKNVLSTLEIYFPGISSSIVASELLSPIDLEDRYGLTQGHIYHGEHAVDQLISRPIPDCARYKTPISGLYLGGSGSHPGGGITGMPGYLSAQFMLSNDN